MPKSAPRNKTGNSGGEGGRGEPSNSDSQKTRYYTPQDVALHNCAEDCWLSLFGQVYENARYQSRPQTSFDATCNVFSHKIQQMQVVLDLTDLILANRGPLAEPLIVAAGTDVSHWFSASAAPRVRSFDTKSSRSAGAGKAGATGASKSTAAGVVPTDIVTGELRTFVDPQTGLTVPYLPMGRFLHVPPNFPTTKWNTNFGLPWWRDQTRVVGKLTRKARPLRVVNILSQQEDQLLIACEDTIADVQKRYLDYNAHAASYTWKVLKDETFVRADMDKNLEDNGILDDDATFEKLGIDDDGYTPVIHIYYNDDLTIA